MKKRGLRMRKERFAIRHLPLVILSFLLFGMLLRCGECASPPATIADTGLPAPQAKSERDYLGLSATVTRFSLDDIRADTLVVDFFDMYCHVCQIRAPHMNEFYKLVQSRGLSGRIKIVGVGVGDTIKEVTVFKEKFGLPFPVFPDRAGSFSKQFGKVKVPNIIAFKKHLGRFEVVYQDSRLPDNAEQFLTRILSYAAKQFSSPGLKPDPECVTDGTSRWCPIVLSPEGASSDKSKLTPSSGQKRAAISK